MSVFPEPEPISDPSLADSSKTPRAPCPRCGVRLEPEFMEIHLLKHSKEKPYACDMCDLIFESKTNLENHLRTHTGERPFKCELCPKRFIQYSNMVSHMKTHSNGKHSCRACNMTFSYYKSLKKHEQSMLCLGRVVKKEPPSVDTPQIKIENVVSHSLERYQEEKQRANEESLARPTEASSHSYGTTSKAGYNRTTHVCQICLAPFISSPLLSNHIQTCSLENVPFHCLKCPRKFKKSHGLNVHRLRAHGIAKTDKTIKLANKVKVKVMSAGILACNLCSRTFNGKVSLRMHMNWHRRRSATTTIQSPPAVTPPSFPMSNSLFKCDLCSNSFVSFRAMRVHQSRAHAGVARAAKGASAALNSPWATDVDYNFECTVCSKKFETNRAMKIHANMHLDKNHAPYLCRKCGKTFPGFKALRVHEHYHTADKTMHECHICEKSFPGLRALRLHATVHRAATGVYQCGKCTQVYSTYRALRVHESYHKGRDIRKCKFCDKQFDKYGMRAHLIWHRKAGIDTSVEPAKYLLKSQVTSSSTEPDEYIPERDRANVEPDEYMLEDENPKPSLEPGEYTPEASYTAPKPAKFAQPPHSLNIFCCRQCPQRFRVRSALMVHLHTHRTKRKCEFCSRWFGSLSWYNKHIAVHKKEGTDFVSTPSNATGVYKCKLCPKRFSTSKSYAIHGGWHKRYRAGTKYMLPNKNAVPTYSCRMCNLTFENAIQLRGHTQTAHRKGAESAPVVPSTFTVPSVPVRKRNNFRCAKCNSMFTTKGLLYQHKRSGCSLTEQELQNQAIERQRMLFPGFNQRNISQNAANVVSRQPVPSESVRKTYQCPKCPKRFTSTWGLKYHSTHAHRHSQSKHVLNSSPGQPKRQFKCKSCSMVFLGRGLLIAHQKESPCQFSERRSSVSSNSTHTSQLHDVTIEYEKPANVSNANVRITSPTSKLWTCRKCPKVFKNIKTLGTHLTLKHKLRYACKICLQSYNSYTGLYYHNTKHHQYEITDPEELYNSVVQGVNSCTICLIAYPTAEKLDRHMKSKHAPSSLRINQFTEPIPNKPQTLQFSDLMPKKRQPSRIQRHYQCELCMIEYRSYNGLKNHKEIVHDGCPVSDNEHMRSYLIDRLAAPESGTKIQRAKTVETGERVSSERTQVSQASVQSDGSEGQTRYPCSMCPKVFSSKQHLNNHLRTHFEASPLFDTSKSLSVEEPSHDISDDEAKETQSAQKTEVIGAKDNENTYFSEPSDGSETKFTSTSMNGDKTLYTGGSANEPSGDFTTPMDNPIAAPASPIPGKLYNCSTCSFSTFSQENLSQHTQTMHPELEQREPNVSQHKSNHVPVDCPICAKRLSCRSALSTHMRIHTGAKPFTCDTCGESFTYKQMLQRHAQRAHGINLAATEIHKSSPWNGAAVMKQYEQQGSPASTNSDEQVNALLKIAEAAVAKPAPEEFADSAVLNQPVFPQEEAVNQPVFPTLYKCDQCSGLFQVESDLIHHKTVHEQTFRV